MNICKILLKIILIPVSLMLLFMKCMVHLAIDLTSKIIGWFIMYVGFCMMCCLVTQKWSQLFILFIVGLIGFGTLFLVMILEETIDSLIKRINSL